MKRAEKINGNIHTYRIDGFGQKFDEELTKIEDFSNKEVIKILREKGEGGVVDMFDEKLNSFTY